jgi:hypothetical protein
LRKKVNHRLIEEATQSSVRTCYREISDQGGRFSIDYPSSWSVNTNGTSQVYFTAPGGPPKPSLVIILQPRLIPQDPASFMNDAVTAAQQKLGDSLVQNIECSKYTFSGQRACSIVLKGVDLFGQPLTEMQVATYVSPNLYVFTYGDSPNNFTNDLPTFDQMISSFKSPP